MRGQDTFNRSRKVAVIGLGYVGLPLAIAMSKAGHRTLGFDINSRLVEQISRGRTGELTVTAEPDELSGCDVYVICVPTPLKDGAPDLSCVESAVETVARNVGPGDLVILESTSWPGTTRRHIAPRLDSLSGFTAGEDFHLAFSSERIDPGNTSFTLAEIPKVVGGLTRADGEVAAEFYGTFVERVVLLDDAEQAEMSKLLENTFRNVNLALVNELLPLCRELGIDLPSCIDAAATKPFGFMPFYPGPGVGGHCIPVDPVYLTWLAERRGQPLRLVETALHINRAMPDYVVRRASQLLNQVGKPVRGSRIVLLGVAYKPDIADVRESTAIPIARQLAELGAEVAWHDPHAEDCRSLADIPRLAELTEDELAGADLVVLHTPHSDYPLTEIRRSAALLLDTRATLGRPDDVRVFGL